MGIFPSQGCGPRSAALQADSLTAELPGKPKNPGVASVQFSSVQSLSRVRLFVTPRTAAQQASLSITNSRSLPKFMSIKSVMTSSHLILCGITVYLRMYSDFKWALFSNAKLQLRLHAPNRRIPVRRDQGPSNDLILPYSPLCRPVCRQSLSEVLGVRASTYKCWGTRLHP